MKLNKLFLKSTFALAFGLSMLMSGTNVWAFGTGFFWGSLSCEGLINGLSKKVGENADLNVSCVVAIKEIFAACTNKPGNADPANGQPFQIDEATIVGLDIGSGFKVTGKGTAATLVNFTDEDIAAALEDFLPGILDQISCPNPNWNVRFAISRLNAATEVLSGASTQPVPGICDVVDVSINPATACNPGPLATCQQEECLFFHDNADGLAVQGFPDNTPCVKPHLDFVGEQYDCECDYQIIHNNNNSQVHQPCQDKATLD
jgi:hypothetical protein